MEGDVYVEPVVAAERVVIFGGGHVGRACVPALAAIDFEVTVFDDRPDVALPENFPDAAHVILGSFKDIAAGITLGARDYVIVMTHGHVADEDVVAQAIGAHPRYLGCMGSRHKRRVLERSGASLRGGQVDVAEMRHAVCSLLEVLSGDNSSCSCDLLAMAVEPQPSFY